jgi:hypothetical protein
MGRPVLSSLATARQMLRASAHESNPDSPELRLVGADSDRPNSPHLMCGDADRWRHAQLGFNYACYE